MKRNWWVFAQTRSRLALIPRSLLEPTLPFCARPSSFREIYLPGYRNAAANRHIPINLDLTVTCADISRPAAFDVSDFVEDFRGLMGEATKGTKGTKKKTGKSFLCLCASCGPPKN